MTTSFGDDEIATALSCKLAFADIFASNEGYIVLSKACGFAQIGGQNGEFVGEFRLNKSRKLWRVNIRRLVKHRKLTKIWIESGIIHVRASERLTKQQALYFLLAFLRGRELPPGLGARDVWDEELN